MNKITGYLYAQPSFLSGVGRSLNILGHGAEYNTSSSEMEADEKAMRADWMVVGDDLREALKSIGVEVAAVVRRGKSRSAAGG